MTDDLIPDGAEPDATARDEELAARLAVPPLDELTRRRLVRDALDAAPADQPRPGRRRPPWWAAAAAIVIVAVAATALALRSGSGSGDRPTAAAPTTRPARTPPPRAESGSGSGSTTLSPDQRLAVPAPAQASAGSLGDLGEVADRATLRKRVASAVSSFSGDKRAFGNLGPATSAVSCAAALATAQPQLGPVLASGTATFHGAPATVVTAREPSGDLVAVVIVDAGCAVEAPVTIPG